MHLTVVETFSQQMNKRKKEREGENNIKEEKAAGQTNTHSRIQKQSIKQAIKFTERLYGWRMFLLGCIIRFLVPWILFEIRAI
jgi:hypothetical protein